MSLFVMEVSIDLFQAHRAFGFLRRKKKSGHVGGNM
jgi:hypothetical protein